LRIAEEARHIDQDIVEKVLHFFPALSEQLQIGFKVLDLAEKHAACNPTLDGAWLVTTEIHAAEVAKNRINLAQCPIPRRSFRRFRLVLPKDMHVLRNAGQLARDEFRRKDVVD